MPPLYSVEEPSSVSSVRGSPALPLTGLLADTGPWACMEGRLPGVPGRWPPGWQWHCRPWAVLPDSPWPSGACSASFQNSGQAEDEGLSEAVASYLGPAHKSPASQRASTEANPRGSGVQARG